MRDETTGSILLTKSADALSLKKENRNLRKVVQDNLEFNVELKNRSDYEFALNKFNELWEHCVSGG